MPPIMERSIKLWEFLIGILAMLITCGGIVYNRGTMDAQNEVKIITLQNQFEEFKREAATRYNVLSDKADKTNDKLNEILIVLQNKEDRK